MFNHFIFISDFLEVKKSKVLLLYQKHKINNFYSGFPKHNLALLNWHEFVQTYERNKL